MIADDYLLFYEEAIVSLAPKRPPLDIHGAKMIFTWADHTKSVLYQRHYEY